MNIRSLQTVIIGVFQRSVIFKHIAIHFHCMAEYNTRTSFSHAPLSAYRREQ